MGVRDAWRWMGVRDAWRWMGVRNAWHPQRAFATRGAQRALQLPLDDDRPSLNVWTPNNKRTSEAWSHFARHSDPNHAGIPQ
jgi:hypothetical protein